MSDSTKMGGSKRARLSDAAEKHFTSTSFSKSTINGCIIGGAGARASSGQTAPRSYALDDANYPRHPCLRPYQTETLDGPILDFNYWGWNKFLVDAELHSVFDAAFTRSNLRHLRVPKIPEFMQGWQNCDFNPAANRVIRNVSDADTKKNGTTADKLLDEGERKASKALTTDDSAGSLGIYTQGGGGHVLIVAVKALDPLDLAKSMDESKLTFFSECTSVPMRHLTRESRQSVVRTTDAKNDAPEDEFRLRAVDATFIGIAGEIDPEGRVGRTEDAVDGLKRNQSSETEANGVTIRTERRDAIERRVGASSISRLKTEHADVVATVADGGDGGVPQKPKVNGYQRNRYWQPNQMYQWYPTDLCEMSEVLLWSERSTVSYETVFQTLYPRPAVLPLRLEDRIRLPYDTSATSSCLASKSIRHTAEHGIGSSSSSSSSSSSGTTGAELINGIESAEYNWKDASDSHHPSHLKEVQRVESDIGMGEKTEKQRGRCKAEFRRESAVSDVAAVFRSYFLVFQGKHSDWQHQLCFQADPETAPATSHSISHSLPHTSSSFCPLSSRSAASLSDRSEETPFIRRVQECVALLDSKFPIVDPHNPPSSSSSSSSNLPAGVTRVVYEQSKQLRSLLARVTNTEQKFRAESKISSPSRGVKILPVGVESDLSTNSGKDPPQSSRAEDGDCAGPTHMSQVGEQNNAIVEANQEKEEGEEREERENQNDNMDIDEDFPKNGFVPENQNGRSEGEGKSGEELGWKVGEDCVVGRYGKLRSPDAGIFVLHTYPVTIRRSRLCSLHSSLPPPSSVSFSFSPSVVVAEGLQYIDGKKGCEGEGGPRDEGEEEGMCKGVCEDEGVAVGDGGYAAYSSSACDDSDPGDRNRERDDEEGEEGEMREEEVVSEMTGATLYLLWHRWGLEVVERDLSADEYLRMSTAQSCSLLRAGSRSGTKNGDPAYPYVGEDTILPPPPDTTLLAFDMHTQGGPFSTRLSLDLVSAYPIPPQNPLQQMQQQEQQKQEQNKLFHQHLATSKKEAGVAATIAPTNAAAAVASPTEAALSRIPLRDADCGVTRPTAAAASGTPLISNTATAVGKNEQGEGVVGEGEGEEGNVVAGGINVQGNGAGESEEEKKRGREGLLPIEDQVLLRTQYRAILERDQSHRMTLQGRKPAKSSRNPHNSQAYRAIGKSFSLLERLVLSESMLEMLGYMQLSSSDEGQLVESRDLEALEVEYSIEVLPLCSTKEGTTSGARGGFGGSLSAAIASMSSAVAVVGDGATAAGKGSGGGAASSTQRRQSKGRGGALDQQQQQQQQVPLTKVTFFNTANPHWHLLFSPLEPTCAPASTMTSQMIGDDKEEEQRQAIELKQQQEQQQQQHKGLGGNIGSTMQIQGANLEKGKKTRNQSNSWPSESAVRQLMLVGPTSRGGSTISENSERSEKKKENRSNDGAYVTMVEEVNEEVELPLRICAIDCEMCGTAKGGLELTRCTVICPERGAVIDTLVKPAAAICNYFTEFSGITKEMLENVTTTLEDVQTTLRYLIDKDTILVGHSLESDLKALKLIHTRVIDTAALYPHPRGLPFKESLKKLAKSVLGKDIQADSENGHDSLQDAAIALELAFHKALQHQQQDQRQDQDQDQQQHLTHETQHLHTHASLDSNNGGDSKVQHGNNNINNNDNKNNNYHNHHHNNNNSSSRKSTGISGDGGIVGELFSNPDNHTSSFSAAAPAASVTAVTRETAAAAAAAFNAPLSVPVDSVFETLLSKQVRLLLRESHELAHPISHTPPPCHSSFLKGKENNDNSRNNNKSSKRRTLEIGLRLSVHSCAVYGSQPDWEENAYGFREEGDACVALQALLKKHGLSSTTTAAASAATPTEKGENIPSRGVDGERWISVEGVPVHVDQITCQRHRESKHSLDAALHDLRSLSLLPSSSSSYCSTTISQQPSSLALSPAAAPASLSTAEQREESHSDLPSPSISVSWVDLVGRPIGYMKHRFLAPPSPCTPIGAHSDDRFQNNMQSTLLTAGSSSTPCSYKGSGCSSGVGYGEDSNRKPVSLKDTLLMYRVSASTDGPPAAKLQFPSSIFSDKSQPSCHSSNDRKASGNNKRKRVVLQEDSKNLVESDVVYCDTTPSCEDAAAVVAGNSALKRPRVERDIGNNSSVGTTAADSLKAIAIGAGTGFKRDAGGNAVHALSAAAAGAGDKEDGELSDGKVEDGEEDEGADTRVGEKGLYGSNRAPNREAGDYRDEEEGVGEDEEAELALANELESEREREHWEMRYYVERVDADLQRLYEAAPAHTTMLVVTQGDLQECKLLAARKMRSRWDQQSMRKGSALADAPRDSWDPVSDEARLLAATAHATAGALFLRVKNEPRNL